MGTAVLLIGVALVSACRYGFDPEARPDAPPPPPPSSLRIECGTRPRFVVGAGTLNSLVAIATPSGFDVFTRDDATALRGWSYDWSGGQLAANAQNIAIDTDVTGTFGAVAVGAQVLLAAIHGADATLGSTYYLLTSTIAERGDRIVNAARVIGATPLATSGATADLAAVRYENGSVVAHPVDLAGGETAARLLVDGAALPSEASLGRAAAGYVAWWVAGAPSPNEARVELLDGSFAVTAGPITIDNSRGFDTIRPRVAWAATSHTYAVAWYEKTPTNDDDTYVQVFDAQLQPVIPPTRIAAYAAGPVIGSDGTDFLVAFITSTGMQAAHVAADGTITMRAVGSSGGTPKAWAMVEREGQPVLVYAEAGGSGPDLWFDPLCP